MHWRTKNPFSQPRWIVGEFIRTAMHVVYTELPVLPTKNVSSLDPIGRPFAYVSMFDPTCRADSSKSGAARKVYPVLVQTPRFAECAWRLPPPVQAFLHNKFRSQKHKAISFDLKDGKCIVSWTLVVCHFTTYFAQEDTPRLCLSSL